MMASSTQGKSCDNTYSRLLSEHDDYEEQDYGVLRNRIMDILDEDDSTFAGRLKDLVHNDQFQNRFSQLAEQVERENGYRAVHDDNIQKRFNAIINERGEYGDKINKGRSYSNNYGRKQHSPMKKQDDHLKKMFDALKYDENSGRKVSSPRVNNQYNKDYRPRKQYYHDDDGVDEEDDDELPLKALQYFDDFEKKSNPFRTENLPEDFHGEYKFANEEPHRHLSLKAYEQPAKGKKSKARRGTYGRKKNRGILGSILHSFAKFVKKSDAMYETELLSIMSPEGTVGSNGKVRRKRKHGLVNSIKDKLTILSPVLAIGIFLLLFVVFDMTPGIVLSSIFLVLSVAYVWYKYGKCKRVYNLYGRCDEKRLMNRNQKPMIMPNKAANYRK
ncbi:Pv-fam-d protein [Plasmodium ovale curtisi]|uniref:Pv-fam-d protein n=1 Tax=Plasmodium ovale curtisi TaxID=864141 RepID=A0A1A8WCV0_PLAOA|nr:Pv-fam-d protein [Plasmodium ovale curtisi]SBT00793.1 Pv-fam-d protein [Plasmodium ovale curtisi]